MFNVFVVIALILILLKPSPESNCSTATVEPQCKVGCVEEQPDTKGGKDG